MAIVVFPVLTCNPCPPLAVDTEVPDAVLEPDDPDPSVTVILPPPAFVFEPLAPVPETVALLVPDVAELPAAFPLKLALLLPELAEEAEFPPALTAAEAAF